MAGSSLACQGQKTLNLPYYEQEGYYSCWAASAEMIMEFLGAGSVRQCEQAGVAFNHPDCCGADDRLKHGLCDQQWYPEFRKWGFDFDLRYWDPVYFPLGDPLSWDELANEICIRGRPFAFSWAKQAGVNHMMVLIGFDGTQGDRMITYLDPIPSVETDVAMVPYSVYKGEGDYPHRDDYFNIRPRTLP
jgi:hypothetical protein